MEDFGVRFAFHDAARFQALRALFAELKKDKDVQEFRDPGEWKAFFPPEVLASFDWPSDEERAEWLRVRHSTTILIDLPEEQIGTRWNFYSVFESVQRAEYLLLDLVVTELGVAELRIEPEAYPYGGLGPFIALVEAFGFEILGVNEYGRFQTRNELLTGTREDEEQGQDDGDAAERTRIVIIGNSGSGKSTLAQRLAAETGAAVLDLDTVAWEPGKIAVPRKPVAAAAAVQTFCGTHADWVVEGCYADLVRATFTFRPRLIFLDPGLEQCLANCRARPWEPHKYASKEEQDERLDFLLSWVAEYYTRSGDMSHARHQALFDAYPGPKQRLSELPGPGYVFSDG
jgi:adenylate kinase family enzyme